MHTPTASGTPQSIFLWAENAKLDPEQQTAFEMLVATYILTFINDTERNEGLTINVKQQKKNLNYLARHQPNKVMRLFITGPAGAGKCKCI